MTLDLITTSAGAGASDRLSVWLQKGALTFECIDSNGERFSLSVVVPVGQPVYVRFEFASDDADIFMSRNVNNTEQDARNGTRPLALDPDLSIFALGADSGGGSGANFLLMEDYAVNRTMRVPDRLGSYQIFKRKMAAPEKRGVHFSNGQHMLRAPDANLFQPDTARRLTAQPFTS